ncbi:MAG: hypothetical protein ACOYBJ_02200 [Patescibacteria group bacterium]|jgi:hypothetical protein
MKLFRQTLGIALEYAHPGNVAPPREIVGLLALASELDRGALSEAAQQGLEHLALVLMQDEQFQRFHRHHVERMRTP